MVTDELITAAENLRDDVEKLKDANRDIIYQNGKTQ